MAQFWPKAAVVNNCVIIDNKLAIPEALRQAVRARLYRSHPGQEALMSASEYIWWPTDRLLKLVRSAANARCMVRILSPLRVFIPHKPYLLCLGQIRNCN